MIWSKNQVSTEKVKDSKGPNWPNIHNHMIALCNIIYSCLDSSGNIFYVETIISSGMTLTKNTSFLWSTPPTNDHHFKMCGVKSTWYVRRWVWWEGTQERGRHVQTGVGNGLTPSTLGKFAPWVSTFTELLCCWRWHHYPWGHIEIAKLWWWYATLYSGVRISSFIYIVDIIED